MACPRCGSLDTARIADSPVPGVWEAFRCQGCNYVWRSTEDLAGIRRYDAKLAERAWSRQSWPLPEAKRPTES